jgi:L-fuculose-phosphate aldolase
VIGRLGAHRRLRREIVEAVRMLHERALVTGTVGNVSARIADTILITPTRAAYRTMRPADVASVDMARGSASGASTELPLHLAIYRARPDVGAVVHTHSPYATAWSFLDAPLEPKTEETEYYGIGDVRTAPATQAGTADRAATASASLRDGNAVLLGGHGVVAVGPTVAAAVDVADAVEHQARIAWLLRDGPGRASPTAGAT